MDIHVWAIGDSPSCTSHIHLHTHIHTYLTTFLISCVFTVFDAPPLEILFHVPRTYINTHTYTLTHLPHSISHFLCVYRVWRTSIFCLHAKVNFNVQCICTLQNIQHTFSESKMSFLCIAWRSIYIHCNTLQRTATHISESQSLFTIFCLRTGFSEGFDAPPYAVYHMSGWK